MQLFSVLTVVYLAALLAGIVVLFWLAILGIRALNIYIAKNRLHQGD